MSDQSASSFKEILEEAISTANILSGTIGQQWASQGHVGRFTDVHTPAAVKDTLNAMLSHIQAIEATLNRWALRLDRQTE